MTIQAPKGMVDIYYPEIDCWQFVEKNIHTTFVDFGFTEIRTPVLESTDLFKRTVGDTTDIVTKEMYTFVDKGERSVTLRPEGTASVVRALIENKLYVDNPNMKYYYIGPMFRYERPQKGRQRQFHQFGVESFGVSDSRMDADMMYMLSVLYERLGLKELRFSLNSLGCENCRNVYKQKLLEFISSILNSLCENCKIRVNTNILRVLDCKNEQCKNLLKDKAPTTITSLCHPCREHFEGVQNYLSVLSVPFELNPLIVRGLDYYNRTTFEVTSENLGAQNAVGGGGRYDGLVKSLGGPELPAVGYASGMERLVMLIENHVPIQKKKTIFVASFGEKSYRKAFEITNYLRSNGIRTLTDYQSKNLKALMKEADKLKADYVFILGEDEIGKNSATIRNMKTKEQREISLDTAVVSMMRVLKEDEK